MRTPTLFALSFGVAACAAFSQEYDLTVVKLFNGLELRGQVLRSDEREMVIRTWVGDKKVLRQEIVDVRRNLTAEEREALLRTINPWKDEQEWTERDKQFASAKVETPKAEPPARRRTEPAEAVHIEPNPLTRTTQPIAGVSNYGTWEERMSAALDKRVTLDLTDDPLEDALNLVASLTGLNVIVAPQVREKQLKVTLNVRSMDAGTVLKWLTKLTDTHVHIKDQAIFISAQAAQGDEDEERQEILGLLVKSGADINLMPPAGAELTNDDRTKLALAIWEKTNPKPHDFPGPDMGLEPQKPDFANPFGNP